MPIHFRAGIEINYDQYPCTGESRGTLAFVPGLSASTRSFPRVVENLRTRYDIVAIDPRGAGLTRPADKPMQLTDIADDLHEVLRYLGIDSVHLLGISMGGMVVQEFILAYPSMVRGLVLTCTMCGNRHGSGPPLKAQASLAAAIVRGRFAKSYDEIADLFHYPLFAPDTPHDVRVEFFKARLKAPVAPIRGLMRQTAAVHQFDSYDRLPSITSPTLVITGVDDWLMPAYNSDILHSRIEHSRLRRLPGGHVFFFTHDDLYAQHVLDFLDDVELSEQAAAE